MPLFNREVIEIVNALERFVEAKYHQIATSDDHGHMMLINAKNDLVDVLVKTIDTTRKQGGQS